MTTTLLEKEPETAGIVVRMARTEEEIVAAQKLRYKVFYEELGATPSAEMASLQRDINKYDDVADHLILEDTRHKNTEDRIIGTYRLIRKHAAEKIGNFYTEDEFDISPLKKNGGELLELGRSCIIEGYRSMSVLQLLWQGIVSYVEAHNINLMFGCGSFPSETNPDNVSQGLSYLYHYHLAPEEIRPRALEHVYVEMNRHKKEDINVKQALMSLPPLIKGYIRAGAYMGDGAFIDHQWNSVDICVVMPVSSIERRYKKHYDRTKDTNIVK
ncbi:MAG: GNAT family N-acetyltransferase [Alphaproteobacteria bacterium]|nr:GNAT family N-acetyltransferase [Alphaproteobacteria bacterium]